MEEDEATSIDSTEGDTCSSVIGSGDIGPDDADTGSPRFVSQDAGAKEGLGASVALTTKAIPKRPFVSQPVINGSVNLPVVASQVQLVQSANQNSTVDAELVVAVGHEGSIDTQPLMIVSQEYSNHDRSLIGKEQSENGVLGVAGHQARPLDARACTSASLDRVTGGQNQQKDYMDARMESSRDPSSKSFNSNSPQRRPPMPMPSVGPSAQQGSTPKSKNKGMLMYDTKFSNLICTHTYSTV